MHNSELNEIVREAIKLEINGRLFFLKAEELTQNDLGKKMFKKLIKDEINHLDDFQKIFSSIISEKEWEKIVKQEQESESSVIEELTSRLDKASRASEIEAIKIGMELEKKAIVFFEKLENKVDDIEIKKVVNIICNEERLHYDLLQAQYDSVTNSGFWLDVAEFRMDAKF
ncbi:MAG: ferritin family protein [Candidatus Cloacimonetes bacterium]|nr:ferritin family protein [Candidatus Cloacimonadota bacterium]